MCKWKSAAETVASETTSALQTLYDSLNQGQQKKVVKNADVKALLDRYGVTYSD